MKFRQRTAPNVAQDDIGISNTLRNFLSKIVNKINGGISLGSGQHNTKSGDVLGVYVNVTLPSVAGTDFTITHNLGYVPNNYLVVNSDLTSRGAIVYTGSALPDSNTITLRSLYSSGNVTIWIF